MHPYPARLLRLLVAALLLAAQAELLHGSASREPASAPGIRRGETQSLTLWWLERRPADTSSAASSHSVVPLALPPYLWSDFTVQNGVVSTSSDAEYQNVQTLNVAVERLSGHDLYRVRLRITLPRPPGGRTSTVQVSFDLDSLLSDRQEVLFQPGQLALMKAIAQSGRESGRARVLSLQRVGARGFSAAVELL